MSASKAPPASRPRSSQQLPVLLLILLVTLRPPRRAAAEPQPGVHELRRRFQDLLSRLRVNQSREDSNSEPMPAAAAHTLTPQGRLGPSDRLLLRIPGTALPQAVPEASRVHRALPRPARPEPWDVTRVVRRRRLRRGRLGRRGSSSPRAAVAPPADATLELQGAPPAAGRGRRSAPAKQRDGCPLGPGRCCRLHTVPVTLDDLGWADWVLSPRLLQVGVCVGECPLHYRPAGWHAQLKGRMHALQPDLVPAPCCVPSSYTPVVVMQRSDAGVSLQTYDDLLARSCHCA